MKFKLIVGLGNPGINFQNTRHNIGFSLLDIFAEKYQLKFNKGKFQAEEIVFKANQCKAVLIKPLTYMNLSGEAVILYQRYYKIQLEDILVIHDDLDFPVGKYRIANSGRSAGNNGISSIIQHLHSPNFYRLRVGIKNEFFQKGKEFVLDKLSQKDKQILNQILDQLLQIIWNFAYDVKIK